MPSVTNVLSRIGIVLMLGAIHLFAQHVRRGEASPISPEITLYDDIGIVAGLPIVFQRGQYYDTCVCPPFTGGSGIGLIAGAIYELPREKVHLFRIGLSTGIEYRAPVSRYRHQELQTFVSNDSQLVFPGVPVLFRQETAFRLLSLWLQPAVRFVISPNEAVWGGLGARIGYVIVGDVAHSKILLQETARLPNGEIITLQQSSGIIRDGTAIGLQRFQAEAVIQLGTAIKLSNDWWLRPAIQYQFPFTELSTSGGMKVTALAFTLTLTRQYER